MCGAPERTVGGGAIKGAAQQPHVCSCLLHPEEQVSCVLEVEVSAKVAWQKRARCEINQLQNEHELLICSKNARRCATRCMCLQCPQEARASGVFKLFPSQIAQARARLVTWSCLRAGLLRVLFGGSDRACFIVNRSDRIDDCFVFQVDASVLTPTCGIYYHEIVVHSAHCRQEEPNALCQTSLTRPCHTRVCKALVVASHP